VRRAPGIPCALCYRGRLTQKLGRIRAARMRSRVGSLGAAHPSRRGLPAAPQDEGFRCGAKSDPHGEEARSAVSNHEAQRGSTAVCQLKLETARKFSARPASFSPCGRRCLREAKADEGSLSAEADPSPVSNSLRSFEPPSPTRGEGKRAECHPALAAFLRYARCTAQVQPGGCDCISFDVTSLAGAAEEGACVGIASFTRRSCVDWSCAGM